MTRDACSGLEFPDPFISTFESPWVPGRASLLPAVGLPYEMFFDSTRCSRLNMLTNAHRWRSTGPVGMIDRCPSWLQPSRSQKHTFSYKIFKCRNLKGFGSCCSVPCQLVISVSHVKPVPSICSWPAPFCNLASLSCSGVFSVPKWALPSFGHCLTR